QFWLGDAKRSKTNAICDLIPKDCKLIHKALDGDKVDFECQAQAPFLKDSANRLLTVKFTTKEQKFVTKVTKAQLRV
ncbi:Top3a, partial [Symbiodinium natans]